MERNKIKVGRRDNKNQLTIEAQIPHDIIGNPISKLELLTPLSFFFFFPLRFFDLQTQEKKIFKKQNKEKKIRTPIFFRGSD